jgi:Zn-finger nucleic acid-binding protein
LRECERCDGIWADAKTFENICADRESNASVMQWANAKNQPVVKKDKIQYIPCPDCKTLMNRNNFARSSGIVVDICKQHGLWFDADELPQIIEFIHSGGLDRARQKEKMQLEEEVRDLRQKEYARSLHKIGTKALRPQCEILSAFYLIKNEKSKSPHSGIIDNGRGPDRVCANCTAK